MIYINGIKATKEDLKKLFIWVRQGKTKAYGKMKKGGILEIVTTA